MHLKGVNMIKRILAQVHFMAYGFKDEIFNSPKFGVNITKLEEAEKLFKDHDIDPSHYDRDTADLFHYLYSNEKRSIMKAPYLKTDVNKQKLAVEKLEKLCKELEILSGEWRPADPPVKRSEAEPKKIVLDPVHGNIVLTPLCVAVINTPQFQRLRNLTQLGVTPYVYPGGAHSRFEHSLGVCYLAGELLKSLRDVHKYDEHVKISAEDEMCVQIAGLCHDLGHGPFSQMFDEKFLPTILPNYTSTVENVLPMEKINPSLYLRAPILPLFLKHNFMNMCKKVNKELSFVSKHEMRSLEMLNHMFRDPANRLVKRFREYGLTKRDFIFIEEQICHTIGHQKEKESDSWKLEGRPQEKSFLYEIVANKRNGVDVDKWDYLARDCHHLGIRSSFDHKRVIRFARIAKHENRTELCLRDKKREDFYYTHIIRQEAYNVYEMYHIRDFLHRFVCQHRVSAVVDIMIVEAMVKANNGIKFRGKDGHKWKLSECVYDMEAFTYLTDNIFYQIMLASTKGLNAKDKADLKEAKSILKSIHQRNLYRFRYQSPPLPGDEFVNEKKAKGILLQCLSEKDKEQLSEHIYVQLVVLDFGKKEANPLRDLHFYKKSDTKTIHAIRLEPHEVSRFLHQKEYREQYVRVFEKPTIDEESRTLLKRALKDFGKIYPKKM